MKIWVLTGGIILLIVLVFIENIRELHEFHTTIYTIKSSKLARLKSSKKIVFLSDLHNYSYGKNNQELLDAIVAVCPDLILIGGDMLVRKDGHSYEDTLLFLGQLPEICPVYYANGNHEQKLKECPEKYQQSYGEYRERLVNLGIHMLENESVYLKWDGINIQITGLEIPLRGYSRFSRKMISLSDLEERIGQPEDAYQILLAHHPAYVPVYKSWGADLILSGHLHGGILRIPGLGGVIGPDFIPFPKYSGDIYCEGDVTTVVSKGLGVHSVPVRLFNPAELVVLELRSGDTEL